MDSPVGRRLTACSALLLAALAGCGPREPVVKVGFVAPLTGDQAAHGEDMRRGAALAIAQAGEVLPGVRVELVALDDQRNPAQAVAMAKKLAADPAVLAVVGHLNSSCTKPAAAIYHQAGLLHLNPVSSNPEISRQGFGNFFRVCATDDLQGPAAARFARQTLGARRVFLIDDLTTYGRGLANEFKRAAGPLGLTVLGHEGITQGEKDFSPLLTRVKALGPDLIYFAGMFPEAAILIKQRAALQIPAAFLGGDGIYEPTLITLATPAASEGIYLTTLGADIHTVPTAQRFLAAYEGQYGPVGAYSAYAYEATALGLQAIRAACPVQWTGAPPDRAAIRRLLDQRFMTVIHPDAPDPALAAAVEAAQTLSDGTVVAYTPVGTRGQWRWGVARFVRPNGLVLTDGEKVGLPLTENHPIGRAEGVVGAAVQMHRATTDLLWAPDRPELSAGNVDLTFAAWVNLDSLGDRYARVVLAKADVTGGGMTGAREYALYLEPRIPRFRFEWYVSRGRPPAAVAVDAEPLSPGTWVLLTAWHDATTNRIGLRVNDGPVQYSDADGGVDTQEPFVLGGFSLASNQHPFDGRIDEVGIWRRLLTEAEQSALYRKALATAPTLSRGLVAYYGMEEAGGPRADATSVRPLAAQAGFPPDRAAVLQAMRARPDYPGILGLHHFDDRGDTTLRTIGIFTVREGKFQFLRAITE